MGEEDQKAADELQEAAASSNDASLPNSKSKNKKQKTMKPKSKSKMVIERQQYLPEVTLASPKSISTRAPVLAFLIHQRFANNSDPLVSRRSGSFDGLDTNDYDSTNSKKNKSSVSGSGSGSLQESKWNTSNSKDNSMKKNNNNATKNISCQIAPKGSPLTFGPYMRTLPPSIPLPICWKRNELALLAGCIPGIPLLQEIAAQTMVLAQDLVALVEGGILHRFPRIFSRGILTWDRWIWAASVHASRILPVSCFLNRGESAEDAFGLSFSSGKQEGNYTKQMKQHSPPEILDELGVMIPLLDMFNHETDAAQVTWEPPSKQELLDSNSSINSGDTTSGGGGDTNNTNTQTKNQDNGAKVVMHKRVKKGSQVYTNYGYAKNNDLMLRYGFAQICNVSDTISI